MELPTPALVTDDTQMTLALGRGLRTATDRGVLGPDMAEPARREFIAWNRSPENNRAPGNTCLRACDLLERTDLPWQDASQIGSKGCGANMRVAPVGLVPGLSDEQRAGAAQLQSALTHGHPTALAASDLTAHAVRLLAQGAEPGDLVGLLRSYAVENRGHYHERWLGDLWTRSQDPSPGHFIARGWDECLAILDRLERRRAHRLARDRPLPGHRRGLDRRRGPGDRAVVLPALPRRAGDGPAPGRLHRRRLGLDRLPRRAPSRAPTWVRTPGPTEWADRIEYQSELVTLGALWDA